MVNINVLLNLKILIGTRCFLMIDQNIFSQVQAEMTKHQVDQALVQMPKDKAKVTQVQVLVVVHLVLVEVVQMCQATKVRIADLMYKIFFINLVCMNLSCFFDLY